MTVHPIDPVYSANSKILILGSFPSVKSREEGFFYAHPQNRFWRVIARLCGAEPPKTIEEKKELIISNQMAVWDVIKSCNISGSSDSSIKDVVVNNLDEILSKADIKIIAANGKKAYLLYRKYLYQKTGIEAVCLPSTSPANAAFSEDKLFEIWSENLKLK